MTMGRPVERATWEASRWGRIALAADWLPATPPPVMIAGQPKSLKITRESAFEYAKMAGYAISGDWVSFVAPLHEKNEKLYVAGDFNGWGEAMGKKKWEMVPNGEGWAVLTIRGDALGAGRLFKFVNSIGVWREPVMDAPNVVIEKGARNHYLDPLKTGAHLFRFEVSAPYDWTNLHELVWKNDNDSLTAIDIAPGSGFYNTASDLPMGAMIEGAAKTRFRLFAPRATRVLLFYGAEGTEKVSLEMTGEKDGCWTALIHQNLEGALYYYRTEGPARADTMFGMPSNILDPWALVVRNGEGVVVDKAKILKRAPAPFVAPAYENLVIVEAHVRDMIAKAPLAMTDEQRRGFAGVKKLMEWSDNPVSLLGVNAVELQPLMEFDGNGTDYAWGYMPINFFAPASAYASDPAAMTQTREVAEMVESFHRKGISVIVDVVFNHIGVPACPLFIDKAYYFRTNADGALTNWSGCGNDWRIESAMAERLCLEALEWWVKAYGVDGFRFDLAELLGADFLAKAERRLRAIKPDIVMIAEPWSFRGQIAASLKGLGYASWNDGYREYLPAYLRGKAPAEGLKYFIGGSVGGMTLRPTQTVNYVESHDDRTWLDKITQNPANNGYFPTLHDRRLTHLMAATLMMSLGVPMWHLGQEALRSKYGVNNTYLRGDLNAYDYLRVKDFPATVEYFAKFVALRKGARGKALRATENPAGYLKFFEAEGTPAIAVLYNATKELDAKRLLFVINPSIGPVTVPLVGLDPEKWLVIADHERVHFDGLGRAGVPVWENGKIETPPVSVSVWVEEG